MLSMTSSRLFSCKVCSSFLQDFVLCKKRCKNFKILALCAKIVAVLARMHKNFFLQDCLARKVQDLAHSCKDVLPGKVYFQSVFV